MREITIGQYYRVDSVLHRLDPRVKLIGTMLFLFSMFFCKGFISYAIATCFLFFCIKQSHVPLRYICKGWNAILVLLAFTFFFNLWLTPGIPFIKLGIVTITKEGLKTAVLMAIRLIYLMLGASLMTLTTTPNHLTDGLESLFLPLQKHHVPVHEMAMMMTIALRFIPILLEEADKIKKAQMARGVHFSQGPFWKRMQNLLAIFLPLFLSAFQRADDLAIAMEARCYRGGEGRTKMNPLCYQKRDRMAYIVLGTYVGLLILLRIWG